MIKNVLKIPFVKYGLLTGGLIFLVKAAIYASGNIGYRFNPVYTFGTALAIVIGVVLAFRELDEIKTKKTYSSYLFHGLLVVLISMTFSSSCDQIFYAINPQIPAEIKNLTIMEFDELDEKLSKDILVDQRKILADSDPKDMVGIAPFFAYITNTSLLNAVLVLIASLFFWLKSRKKDQLSIDN